MTVEASDIKLWVMGGLLTILVPSVAYFLIREFNRKDKLAEAVEKLHSAVGALTLAVEEIRLWSTERFVTRVEHRDALEAVKADIARHAERFERELERCEQRCPDRCGSSS